MFTKQSLNPNSALIFNSNILIIDDTALNRELISTYLEREGYTNVEMAENGQDALDKMKNFMPDLIICDLLMPIMGGIEFIRTIKKSDNYYHIPVIVQTALTTHDEKQEAWSSGAHDVLSKPIHRLELLSRVKVQLTTTHMIQQLENYYNMAQKDVRQAYTLQKTLLPSDEIIEKVKQNNGVEVDFIFEPSRFLSGDLWGLIPIDENHACIWICDYSGKGIQAALNTFRIHTLVQEYKKMARNPGKMLSQLNQRFHSMIQVGQFATFLLGTLDKRERAFRYVSASAPDPIFYEADTGNFFYGDGAGLPLGVSPESVYEERIVTLKPNQSIVLYSDLFWEPNALPGVCFLPEHLPALFSDIRGKKLVPAMRQHLHMLDGDMQLNDDLTLIEISC